MDVTDFFNDVRAFHEKFALAVHPSTAPTLLDADTFRFRLDFLGEELKEFVEAHDGNDLAKAADALVDLVYVALGTAHLMGLPFDLHWRAVQEKNMMKERACAANDERSKRRHALDVVKPVGWTPPDHQPILDKATRDHGYVFRSTDEPS